MHKHYAQKATDYYDGKMYPRVFRISVGDIFTTNMLAEAEYKLGDKVAPGEDGILAAAGDDAEGVIFQVVKEYTMPDGQPAVKLQCIAE